MAEKEAELSDGVTFIVNKRRVRMDAEDYAKWLRRKGKARISPDGCLIVEARHRGRKNPPTIYSIARLIAGAWPGEIVDHINGDRLDNRRRNLRTTTASGNAWNNRQKPGASGYIGVWIEKGRKLRRYKAVAHKARKKVTLGRYKTAEEAARARDHWVIENRDQYATLNFPSLRKTE